MCRSGDHPHPGTNTAIDRVAKPNHNQQVPMRQLHVNDLIHVKRARLTAAQPSSITTSFDAIIVR